MARNPQVLWGRVGAVVGGMVLAIPGGFFTSIAFVFSLTGPPGSPYPLGEMVDVFLLFFVGPIALGAFIGRTIGRLLARLHRDYDVGVTPTESDAGEAQKRLRIR